MLLEFAQERDEVYYSEKLGFDFVEKNFNILQKNSEGSLKQSEVQNLRVIRMLGDFQLHGSVLRRYYKHKEILHSQYFIEVISNFKQYCIDKEYSTVTIGHYTKQSAKFLDYGDSHGLTSCNEINLTLIYNYIQTLAGYTYKKVELQLCSLRSFFKYLHLSNMTNADYSLKIPMVQSRKQTRIPSVWSVDGLKKLISAIDRGNPMGKRDYAMILLACRFGLHSLRHTLASLLLENNTPLPTISDILGHVDTESTAVYLKVDIKKLKECPLNIKEDINHE